jgi:hypothetical protein
MSIHYRDGCKYIEGANMHCHGIACTHRDALHNFAWFKQLLKAKS